MAALIPQLPGDLQDYILTEYRRGLRTRRVDHVHRTIRALLDQIHTLCQTDESFNHHPASDRPAVRMSESYPTLEVSLQDGSTMVA